MLLSVNGQQREVAQDTTLDALVGQLGYRPERIAVELNGQIVPKGRYGQVVLHDRDAMEIVNFVGGG